MHFALKKLLLILVIAVAAIYGCKKDSGTKVVINSSDMAVINGQLRGLWLFPTNNQTITDESGKLLASNGFLSAPAYEFDGGGGATIITNTNTRVTGTYQLSTKDGLIFLDVTDNKGVDITYQVLLINNQTLKIVSKTPTVYNNGIENIPGETVSNIVLQKQSSADETGKLVKVVITGATAPFNVSVFVTHKDVDTATLLDTRQNVTGAYSFAFPTTAGDQLNAVVDGDYSLTSFYAYYDGLPMTGDLSYGANEFKTTGGWKVP